MRRLFALALGLAGSAAAPLHAQDECPAPAALVEVRGLKDRAGRIRIEVYSDAPGEFLASRKLLQAAGKFFAREEIDVPVAGEPRICVSLPAAGRYTMAVLHDRNADGKLNVFSDGYGFPGNPKLGLDKPPAAKAMFVVSDVTERLEIIMNYWNGLGASPISGDARIQRLKK